MRRDRTGTVVPNRTLLASFIPRTLGAIVNERERRNESFPAFPCDPGIVFPLRAEAFA